MCHSRLWPRIGTDNEVILDKWHKPWQPDLQKMVEAVFISPWASAEAEAYGRAVHLALVQLMGVDPIQLPLVTYDYTAKANPFQLESSTS